MESLSLESTIESPTKPHQEKAPDKDKKSMFLINSISDEKIKEQESQNLENKEINENGAGKEKILENHSISRLLKNAKKINTCNYCGGKFDTEEDLKNHAASCRGAKFACKFCDFCENDMNKFWKHLIETHKNDVVKALDENNN